MGRQKPAVAALWPDLRVGLSSRMFGVYSGHNVPSFPDVAMLRTSAVSVLWPAHPKPQPDELLSSWLMRLSRAHGLKLQTFGAVVWPGKAIWNRDIDRSADDEVLNVLSSRTATSAQRVRETTLAAYESRLFERFNPNGYTRWILPLGLYHRLHRSYGLQACPLCLRDDEDPYYRRAWRLACTTVCVRHDVPLIDRCPACRAPLNFHRVELGDRSCRFTPSLTLCHACRFDLMDAEVAPIDDWSSGCEAMVQHRLSRYLREGWVHVPGDGVVYGALYFGVLRQVARLLSSGRSAERLRSAVCEHYGLSPFDLSADGPGRQVEDLGVNARRKLVTTAFLLLECWPETFVSICERLRLWASSVLRDYVDPPYWFARVVLERLDRSSYKPTVEEIAWCIAKNQEVFGGRYCPPCGRIRFQSVWNAHGLSVSPHAKKAP